MTSLSCGVDALLKAAQYLQYLEEQESGQPLQQQQAYRPIVIENPPISTDDDKQISSISSSSPSLVVISRPSVNFNPQSVSIDLSKNNNAGNAIPLSTLSNGTNSITIYHNIDESQTSLNLSTESSGYVSNSTTSSLGNVSLNQSGTNGDDIEIDGKNNAITSVNSNNSTATLIVDQRIPSLQQSQTTFSALPMPQSSSSSSSVGRRRTISSNSNSSALRSPSTVRAGTREVHNKLEKNRRAHLKECFESLKRQLPVTADEKKTSNLSILGAAIRHIQFLKRKEREYEHEMERLAKEKIAAQNRILFLKRELAQWDVDFSKILPEQSGESLKSERGNDLSHESPIKIFNPSATLSSLTPTLSNNTPNLSTNGNSLATISPPPRIGSITPQIQIPATMTPLSLTTKEDSSLTINPAKISSKPALMPVTTSMSMANQISNTIPATLSLKQNDNVSTPSPLPATVANQCMPLNLHATASFSTIQQQQQQPPVQNGLKNGFKNYHHNKEMKSGKSLSPIITANLPASITTAAVTTPISTSNSASVKSSSIEQNDPPTKLIKLINGNAILASMDKDNKMIHSGLTLQQVVGGGGLVVSSLLTTPQGFKVINQPNGLTTIELSPQINGQAPPAAIQRPTQITSAANNISQTGNLQKLLLNGSGTTSPVTAANINTISIPSLAQQTNGSNNHRLTPGGAELNLLPSSNNHSTTTTNNNNGAIYRSQGKLIVKESNNSSSRVHVVQSTTPVVSVVSQPQNSTMTHIITSSSPHLTGKMLQQPTTQQYLSTTTATVKPMIVVNNNGNGSPTSINEIGKI